MLEKVLDAHNMHYKSILVVYTMKGMKKWYTYI